MLDIPCVIFAGGKSSRMGEDKSLLPFGGFDTLTHYQYSRLSKIFQNVYISCKESSKFNFEANFIEDETKKSEYAPTAGFIAAFNYLKNKPFFVISVDAPFISHAIITKIIDADSPKFDATIAKTLRGIEPMCGIYHPSLAIDFQEMFLKKNHKLSLLLHNVKTNFVLFKDEKPFLNLNHPQEYQQALRLLHN